MNCLITYWTQRNIIFLTSGVAFISLMFAYVAQYFFDVNPCILCYYERYIYGSIVALGALTLLTKTQTKVKRTHYLFLILGLILCGGIALGIYHLGVEWHWWQGTAACHGITPQAQSIEELRHLMATKPMARCDQINWRIFGISATFWNLLWFIGFSLLWFATAIFNRCKK